MTDNILVEWKNEINEECQLRSLNFILDIEDTGEIF